MGMRLLVIPRTKLADFFRIKGTVLMEGLPLDAEIVAISDHLKFETDEIVFRVQSKEWPDERPGHCYEQVRLEITEAVAHLTYQDLFFTHHRGRGLSHEQVKADWAAEGHSYQPSGPTGSPCCSVAAEQIAAGSGGYSIPGVGMDLAQCEVQALLDLYRLPKELVDNAAKDANYSNLTAAEQQFKAQHGLKKPYWEAE